MIGDLNISVEERAALSARGFLILGRALDQSFIDGLCRTACELAEKRLGYPNSSRRIVALPDIHRLIPTLNNSLEGGCFHNLALQLMGWKPRVVTCQLIGKPGGCPEHVHWHRDSEYAPSDCDDGLTFWIPLTAATIENGCLWYLPGSHRWNDLHNERTIEPESTPMLPGDIAVHTRLTLHRSGPNVTRDDRWALMLEWISDMQ